MFTQTHRLIGETLGTVIRSKHPDILDEKVFQYGCVIPDYHYKLATIPHYKSKSFEFVVNLINKNRCLPQTTKEKQKFSADLGIVTHYICDYFCQAHNFKEYENWMDHLIYERKLSAEFHNYNLKKYCINSCLKVKAPADLPAFINDLCCQYNNEKRLMITDISYCLNAATTIALTVVGQVQCKVPYLAA